MKLVIVESPNKCRKISEYLGSGYEVVATVGHFRDLPDRELGVDVRSMTPTYVTKEGKEDVVKKLRARAKFASEIILATDADREGEAISWHVAQTLGLRNPKRMRFLEITAPALKKAVLQAGPIDDNLVNAQQARRVVDRLVGYLVSPLLRPLGSNHSAGRVQSATLHLVMERERAREAFKAQTYWTLEAAYQEGFKARFAKPNAKGELTDARLSSEAEAKEVLAAAAGVHVVRSIKQQTIEQRPKPPFTTSTLQQAASAQLGMKPQETMRVAQTLFESGGISYHRTDAVILSDDAIKMARDFIALERPDLLPRTAPQYRAGSDSQGAHEAIRPTSLSPPPTVPAQGQALFDLIRRRFLASQCKPALLAQQIVTLEAGATSWLAKGSEEIFDGHRFYLRNDEDTEQMADNQRLPTLSVGTSVNPLRIDIKRDATKPPPRFTQGTLIKEMERVGIGRPATLATTLKTLFDRTYIEEQKKALLPTDRGRTVDGALSKAFSSLVQASYTAELEARLDDIESGKRNWKTELQLWFSEFEPRLMAAQALIAACTPLPKASGTMSPSCTKCNAPLLSRQGVNGSFWGCSRFPACRHTEVQSKYGMTRHGPANIGQRALRTKPNASR